LRSKIVKLNKNVEETETSTSVIENEEKHSRLLEIRRMKKIERVMQKHSKEGIMVKPQRSFHVQYTKKIQS
jgi:hypothetical protein